jgi:GT2 family glycosyltransferase
LDTVNDVTYALPTLGTRPDWLRTCLRSLTSQDVDSMKIVVVGPTASPAAAIARDAGVEYLNFDRPGLSAAINEVWQTAGASSGYLAWLGDDDGLAPHSVRSTRDFLEARPDCVAAYGHCRMVWASGEAYAINRPGRFAASWLPYGSSRVPQQGSLFRGDVVRRLGGLDESLRYAMDYDLFLRLRQVGRLGYIPRELAFYRQHGEAISFNKGDGGSEHLLVRRRYLTRRLADGEWLWSRPAAVVDRVVGIATRHNGPVTAPPHDRTGQPYVADGPPNTDGAA